MTAGEIKSGDCFRLPTGKWFRNVGHLLHKAGIEHPKILPDAVSGIPAMSHQNSIVVQEQMTGGFFHLDCWIDVEQPDEEEESG